MARTPSRPVPLHALTVSTLPEAEEAVAEALLRLTGESAIITHHRDTGLSTVAVYFRNRDAWGPTRRRALNESLKLIADCGLRTGPARIAFRPVPRRDWRDSWKRHFQPLSIGRALLLRPSWSRRRSLPGQAVLVLDPGLSFGTGQHPTTHFCLREVARLRPAHTPRSLLDVGTGSGVLALAAAKLGYSPIDALDFDADAVAIARRNAARNRVAPRVAFRVDDAARLRRKPRQRFDVVCANLTADLLLRHADRLLAQVAPGGRLVLAGILAEEYDALRGAFEDRGWVEERSTRRREWRSATFRRA